MQVDYFKDLLVPVIGGLGVFMLGIEFTANRIQALAVNKMRAFLGRVAGTPIKGVLAGTFITGIIQSSTTAMTVMVVGLVNAGVMGLRPAISVIMGANIGTTLGPRGASNARSSRKSAAGWSTRLSNRCPKRCARSSRVVAARLQSMPRHGSSSCCRRVRHA